MANRLQCFLLKPASKLLLCTSLVFAAAIPVSADSDRSEAQSGPEQIFEPSLERREIKNSAIDSEDFEIGIHYGVISIEDFGSTSLQGARLDYHVTEDFFFEATLGQATAGNTSFENLAGNIELLTEDERDLTYYNLGVGYNLFHGEAFIGRKAFNSSFYLVAGASSYDFAGDTHSGIAFGAGYRLLLTDWLTWRIDFRDQVFDLDILGEDKTTHNLEFTTGFTVFF